jgi:acyl-coenzyme A thioesterase PaaI-like protein
VSDTIGALGKGSILAELGLHTRIEPGFVGGDAIVVDELCGPAGVVRTSVLGTWADILAGAVACEAIDPRIPLTLDLEVQVLRPLRSGAQVAITSSAVKVGRTVILTETRFHEEGSGEPAALAFLSFIASPDPTHVWPGDRPKFQEFARTPLEQPLAERFGTRVVEPGVVEVPHRPDGLNMSGAIQGGLAALGIEEAALSTADGPAYLDSFVVRYLRPSLAAARAEAQRYGDRAVVRLVDAETGRLGASATAHWQPADGVA